MDTIVRPPDAPPDQPVATGTGPRRWRRRVAVAMSFILGVAFVAGIAWVTNVEPLSRGSSGFPVHDPGVEATSRYVEGLGVSGLVNTVRVDPGSTFRYDVTIRNDGPFPITIEGIGDDGVGAITRRAVAFAADPYNGGTLRTVAHFSPFRLDPHQEAFIEMEVRVGREACLDRSGYVLWYMEPVTYRTFGITRHSAVGTGTEIRVEGKDGPTPGWDVGA
jgi:hypothetical protein